MAGPATMPVTTPEEILIVAVVVGAMLHTPPPAPLPSAVVPFTHTAGVPDMAVGIEFTVTTFVVEQPVGRL